MATIEISSTDGAVFFPKARAFWGKAGINSPTVDANDEIPWLLSCDVKVTKHATVGTFKATFALFADPAYSYEFWGSATQMGMRIEVSFDQATTNGRAEFIPWTTLITGVVTDIRQDVTQGVVTVLGRELTAAFNAANIRNAYTTPNVKDILTEYIESKGFIADVDGALDVDFGIERKEEKAYQVMGIASREISIRDLITKLKNDFGAEVWADKDGKTVHVIINPDADNIWVVNAPTPDFLGGAARHHPSNFTRLIFDHNLVLSQEDAPPVLVGTRLDTHNKKCDTVTSPEGTALDDNTCHTVLQFDGHSPEDAQRHANSRLLSFIMREWLVEWHTSNPRLVQFEVNDLVVVQGTNSDNDGPYGLDYIEYSIDAKNGYRAVFHGIAGRGAPVPDGGNATGS